MQRVGVNAQAPGAGVAAAIANALRLLDTDPAAAARQARELLKASPGHPGALLLLGMAANAEGDYRHAAAVLEPLAHSAAGSARAWLALGVARIGAGEAAPGMAAVQRAIALEPALPCAWLTLAEARHAAGDDDGANAAYLQHLRHSDRDQELMAAASLLARNELAEAERRLRHRLKWQPGDVAAMRMLAEACIRLGRNDEALGLLERVLERAPGFDAARQNYAVALNRSSRFGEALAELEALLEKDPGNQALRNMKAAVQGKLGDFDSAIATYEAVIARVPDQAPVWINYGHALKTAGRSTEAIADYRRCLQLQPAFGAAWFGLANLKIMRFDAADIAAMERQLQRGDLDDDQRLHLEVALGKALEDAGDHPASFAHYARGNALRRKQLPYDADQASARNLQAMRDFSAAFFAARAGSGLDAADPIFVVGMPRSGSTLVEQILASHPRVEGTM